MPTKKSQEHGEVPPAWRSHHRLEPALHGIGWSQADLARALKVTSGAVSRWCSGSNDPGCDGLEDICRATGISADFMLGLSADPNAVRNLREQIAALHAASAGKGEVP